MTDNNPPLTQMDLYAIGLHATPEQVQAINNIVDLKVRRERERCADVVRTASIEAGKMCGRADVAWHQVLLRSLIGWINPEEMKCGTSREQEMQDAISEAEMNMRERCAKIADGCGCMDSFGRDQCGCGWIADKIRSNE